MGAGQEPVTRDQCVAVFIPLHDTNPLKRIRFQYVTVALIVTAVWMRFMHHPSAQHRVTLAMRPDRCALSLRF